MFKCLSPGSLGLSAGANELIEPALSYGFKGLELDVVAFADQVEREGLPTARRLLDSAKLKSGYFRLPFDLSTDEASFGKGLEALSSQAELAAGLGCSRAVTQLAAADERPIHQNFDFHRRRLSAVAKVLETHEIELGIGFTTTSDAEAFGDFEFVRSFDTMALLLSMIGAKNIGVAVDLFELWACESSFEAVQRSKAKVTTLFLSDVAADAVPADALQTARLLPGETGTIDSVAVLAALAEAGYDGPVVPMPHAERFAEMGRQQIFKTTSDKLDEVWKAAGLTPAGKLATVKR